MPDFTTPVGSRQRYIAALNRSQGDRVPGTKKIFADRQDFLDRIADERACIAMGLPVWFDGIDLKIMAEPASVQRLWSLSTSAGSPTANAAASHGRTVVIGAFSKVLFADASLVHATTGVPAPSLGANGDLALDAVAGIVYEKASGAWSLLVAMYGGGSTSPLVPGAVRNLAAGTATANSQPLTWDAPETGAGPFTYQVAYRLGTSTGAFINFGAPVSSTSATVTGLAANTGYDYQITPINAAGPGAVATLEDIPTAASGGGTVPTIDAAPSSQTIAPGGTATFNVSIGGTYTDVEWQVQPPGSAWADVSESSTTLTLTGVDIDADQTKVRVRAVNGSLVSDWSSEAVLTVAEAGAVLRASAPFDALFSGAQNSSVNDGHIDCGNVTLRADGDWAIFLSTNWRSAALNMGGGLLSIGDQSDTLLTGNSALAIGMFGSGASNPWSDGSFAGVPFATARDDNGIRVTNRQPPGTMVPGTLKPYMLVGKPSTLAVPGNVAHSFLVTCEAGVVKFWDCDPGHEPILQDAGPGGGPGNTLTELDAGIAFTGIANKPMVLGMLNHVTQNAQNLRTYWGGPISQVVVYNGGTISKAQARLLSQGIDARDVLTFDAARGDRYWPGNALAGDATKMEELIAGQHGTVVGVGVTFPATTKPQLVYEAVTCGWRPGTVWTAANQPATTTALRMWGNRRGPGTTTIQARIVAITAAFPAAGADIVQDWADVATSAADGPWAGNFVVPHLAGYWFVETRFRKADTSWSDPVRLQGQYAIGDGVLVMGQSILAKFNDDAGTRAVSAGAQGKINTYNKHMPVYSINRVLGTHRTGWLRRAATSYTDLYGQTLYCDLLANVTGRHAYMMHCAIQGISLSRYNVPGNTWDRVKEAIHEARPKNFIWNNGQGDAAQNEATRWPELDKLYAQLEEATASAPGGAYTDWVLGIIPVGSDFVTAGLNTTRNSDQLWVEARQAQGWKVCLATTLTDVPNTLDGVHYRPSLNEQGAMAERLATFVAWRAGFSTHDANGGYLKTATYTYDSGTQVLTIKQPITGGNGSYATKGGGNPSGFRISVNGASSVVPTSTSLAGNEVTVVLEGVASAPTSVGISYLSGYPGPTAGGATTPETTSGIDNALYDVRTGMVSASKGMPVRANPTSVLATPA
ncbi:fibronectin type III domain-containing protein [Pseudorhodoferax sp. LjRoot39]|uniref:fibronectin type III domain-containing protein n=1 Tax=Pseudorhodoferax sp. LjRoot39 TaxID=3342328 RepID=UPI003ED0D7DB